MPYTIEDRIVIEEEINAITNKRADEATMKKQYELKMSLLKNKLRSNNLSGVEYKELCDEQDKCKIEIQKIQRKLDELKKRNADKHVERERIYAALNPIEVSGDILDELKSLRYKYNQFASDHTRVSSTRLMAAKFVGDLDIVIKMFKK